MSHGLRIENNREITVKFPIGRITGFGIANEL